MNKADLLKDGESYEQARQADEAMRKKESEKFSRKLSKERLARAKGLLDGQLGALLRDVNRNKHKQIKMNEYHTYVPDPPHWNEYYSAAGICRLEFEPEPGNAATRELVQRLMAAGYSVKLETEQYQNTEIYGDDKMRDADGTHPVYFIIISWE